jgi:hypothetical protein
MTISDDTPAEAYENDGPPDYARTDWSKRGRQLHIAVRLTNALAEVMADEHPVTVLTQALAPFTPQELDTFMVYLATAAEASPTQEPRTPVVVYA